ncbi:vomeronasal type-1 receptor 4-like [Microtus ochrogaster]|uniref:Vomeronasal type-1 receptor n=1 Tax=Microtus ochrogaster TaxID=79684 RepID=A0ABM0LSL0_MICOH|nr:vomeronasal type-1 receptor 4-like [Microtus ochrogaster]
MGFWNLAIRIIFLSQTTTGILGNFFLIFYYLLLYYKKCTLKHTDWILVHLMAANALIILSAGVPQTVALWGFKHFLNDVGCKFLLYFQGFSRSVSIGTTCFLSVFQVLTISPRNSCWKDYKIKVEKSIGCHISLLWILYMLVNSIHFAYTLVNRKSNNVTRKWDFGYCRTVGLSEIGGSLYAAFVVCPEVIFSVFMVWSSGSMVHILYKHKQRVQYIHRSCRTSPESRVTQNILILVSTFLTFYTLSSIFRGYTAVLYNQNWWLKNINDFVSLCFPSFVPIILIYHYSILSKLCLGWIKNKNYSVSF